MKKDHQSIVAKVIGVKSVSTNELQPNPHNPRILFDKQPLGILQDSINRVGILVPLTVYWDLRKKHYVILDGQRRWVCAQKIGLSKVPVNQVEEPSLVQNIVTMFQIHKLREDWELMPTALKVELLMSEINDRNDARLAELTGLDEAVVSRCKKLISYDNEFQDMMLDPDPSKRMKADFFIELYSVIHDRDVVKFEWFSQKKFIKQMLDKYLVEPRTLKAVTDFRLIKQHITNARRIRAEKVFSGRLKKFAEERETPLEYLEIDEANVRADAKAIVKKLNAIEEIINDLDTEKYYGEEELWNSIKQLIKILEEKLQKANKRR
ncbi:MAG TPA: ParB N-terminal domain-containing protein [Verrucomicrobiae bacterium]|jgi:ParB/RepB/Spo0J family partition protein|nr:ParB N-terminal domain-containing protein [Verrucomicrobiae bacterium]